MKGKYFITLLAAASMTFALTACQSESNSGDMAYEDMSEIVVVYPSMGAIPAGLLDIEMAINEISEQEINTHVTLTMLETGNYDQQMNLMLSSGEPVDLMVTLPMGSTSLTVMASQNQLTDLSQLLPEYAPTVVSELGGLLDATSIGGQVMAVPTYRGCASGLFIVMRTDVLEDLGLLEKAKNMKSFKEYEEILEAVKTSEKWKNLAGIVPQSSGGSILPKPMTVCYADQFSDTTFVDNLGNTQYAVSITDNGSKVENAFATEAFKKNYEIVKAWNDKGYIYADSATTTESGDNLIKSNVAFSEITTTEYVGADAAAAANCGMEMTSVLIARPPLTTGDLSKFTWAVPSTSKNPEAAAAFLELMFTDSRVANLFAWGIEGTDYEVDANGIAHYIAGNETPSYHTVSFLNPNCFLLHPWEGYDADYNEVSKKVMDETPKSPYLGFSVDAAEISGETSAITNVIAEFQPQILSGDADENTFNSFLDKLNSSGMERIVHTYQEQLDVWQAQ